MQIVVSDVIPYARDDHIFSLNNVCRYFGHLQSDEAQVIRVIDLSVRRCGKLNFNAIKGQSLIFNDIRWVILKIQVKWRVTVEGEHKEDGAGGEAHILKYKGMINIIKLQIRERNPSAATRGFVVK